MVDLDEDAEVASPSQISLTSIDRWPRYTIRKVPERHASDERHILPSTGFMLLASSAGHQLTGEHQMKRRRRGEAACRWVRSIGSLGRCTQHCPVILKAPPMKAPQIRSVGLGVVAYKTGPKDPDQPEAYLTTYKRPRPLVPGHRPGAGLHAWYAIRMGAR